MLTSPPQRIYPHHWPTLAQQLLDAAAKNPDHRYLLGLAGIPASGKSTFAQHLLQALLHAAAAPIAVLIPMDGFHLPNRILDQQHLRRRKGAPETFDAAAYIALLRQARDPAIELDFPIYDRTIHDPVRTGRPEHRITRATRILITEGNYLLLDRDPWSALDQILDECWFLETPIDLARHRILARHIRGGRSPHDAQSHYDQTDRPNTDLILRHHRTPSRRITWDDANNPASGTHNPQ